MKRDNWRTIALIVIIVALLAAGLFSGSRAQGTNWGALVSGGILVLWLALIRAFDRRVTDPRAVALVATMAAMATLGRVAFAPIAGFKPTTFIVMITGYVCGPGTGFAVGALSGFASNFFLGQGPWTPWQMACWGLCGLAAGLMGQGKHDFALIPFVILSGICGILFGWVMNIWHWVYFIEPLTLKTFVATYIASAPFDVLHAAGNIAFGLILGRPFYQVLNRVYSRIRLAYIPSGEMGRTG